MRVRVKFTRRVVGGDEGQRVVGDDGMDGTDDARMMGRTATSLDRSGPGAD